MMVRRAWRVIAAPPLSRTAGVLRLAVPVWAVASVLGLVLGLVFGPSLGVEWSWSLPRLSDAVWLYVVLVVVRQRDRVEAGGR
ncbi:hypothetical protein ACBJ59_10820 [Nonomuraea sp. MTCD27]|uniref:hypothetical protein n=1 Tax=Nonomuraea sp. MTCD27 TaxID=1676747 RepID=UPI0035C0736A